MPSLGESQPAATLVRWLKSEGDAVQAGEAIAELETEKSTSDLEAPKAGKLGRIMVAAGTCDVAAGTPLAMLSHGADDVLPNFVPAPPAQAPASRPVSVREALNQALSSALHSDPNVILLGEAAGADGGVCDGLLAKFGPERVIETPPCHQAVTGMAIGAAMTGLKPVVEFMSWSFALQAFDQIINNAAKLTAMSGGAIQLPLVLRGPHGHVPRAGAQHSQNLAALLSHVPNLKVLAIYDAASARDLLRQAIADPDPVILLEHDALYGQSWIFEPAHGRDVLLISYGASTMVTAKAVELLKARQIDAGHIALGQLRPLDRAGLQAAVGDATRVAIIDEGWPQGGIAAELAATVTELCFAQLAAPVMRICGADAPASYAAAISSAAVPTAETIAASVTQLAGSSANRAATTQAAAFEPAATADLERHIADAERSLAALRVKLAPPR